MNAELDCDDCIECMTGIDFADATDATDVTDDFELTKRGKIIQLNPLEDFEKECVLMGFDAEIWCQTDVLIE